MTAVTASADVRWEFPTPVPKFPLGGVARSMAVKLNTWDAPSIQISSFTRTWSPIYTGMPRSMDVKFHVGMLDGHNYPMDVYVRKWNGFGGIQYLPSFPQLSRNETTWPHAT